MPSSPDEGILSRKNAAFSINLRMTKWLSCKSDFGLKSFALPITSQLGTRAKESIFSEAGLGSILIFLSFRL